MQIAKKIKCDKRQVHKQLLKVVSLSVRRDDVHPPPLPPYKWNQHRHLKMRINSWTWDISALRRIKEKQPWQTFCEILLFHIVETLSSLYQIIFVRKILVTAVCVLFRLIWNSLCNQNALISFHSWTGTHAHQHNLFMLPHQRRH